MLRRKVEEQLTWRPKGSSLGRAIRTPGYDPRTRLSGDRMRHTVTAAATVLLLALGATACGSSTSPGKADHKPTPSGTPSPTTSAEREGQYILASQDIDFTTRRPSNDELLSFPPQWCKALDEEHSVAWTFSGGGAGLYPSGPDWGTVEKDADRLLVVGVRVYCPQHLDAVTRELRETGKY